MGKKVLRKMAVPPTICQDIAIPSLEFVSTPYGVKDVLAGFKAEMVGVVET